MPPLLPILGQPFISFSELDSTNEEGRRLIEGDLAQSGMAIFTANQQRGKGQRGKSWTSTRDQGVALTLLIEPHFLTVSQQFLLTGAVAIGVRNYLATLGGIPELFKIKWPNDILVDGKKISGILIENNVRAGKVKSMIFGIGLNINQQSFLNLGATSMALIRGFEFSIDEVSLQLTKEFNHWISFVGGDHKTLKLEYLKGLYGLNKNYRFKSQDQEFEGVIVGVNDCGELEINMLGEIRTFKNKEISFLM